MGPPSKNKRRSFRRRVARKFEQRKVHYHVGIIIRDRRVVITKVREFKEGNQLIAMRHFDFASEGGHFRQLEHCLKTMPPNFFKHSTVYLCVPFRQFVSQKVSIPKVSEEDKLSALAQVVDGDHEIWDYEEFSEFEKDGVTFLDITIHKIKRSAVEGYLEVCKPYVKRINAMTVEPLVLRKWFRTGYVTPIDGTFIVMDLGFRHLKIYVFDGHEVAYYRVVPIGMEAAIESLVRSYRVGDQDIELSKEDARELLESLNLFDYTHATCKYPADRLFFQCRPFFEKVALECKKTMNFYLNRHKNSRISSVVIMGGFLKIKGIEGYLKEELETKIDRFQYHHKISRENRKKDPRFEESICFGIATGKKLPEEKTFNVLPKEYVDYHRAKRWRLYLALIGVGLVFALMVLVGAKWWNIRQFQGKLAERQASIQEVLNVHNAKKGGAILKNEMERLQYVERLIKFRIPVELLMYELSQNSQPSIVLSKLSFDQDRFVISGYLSNSPSQIVLENLAKHLESLPYFKSLKTNIQAKESDSERFDIEGEYQ